MKRAKEVDDDLKRGRFRGPLQGIPFAAKDLLSVAGQITTWGAKPYAAQVLDHDATALVKLGRSGAILIGKLAMVELAGGGVYRYPAASLFGAGLNPWDRTRWSGGSSSGSGSAVAAGLVPLALGSETLGSIVTPSAFCGVTGLRPTYGLVSRYGAMALSWTMDKLGPMCRAAEDCGIVLQAISGGDHKDPGTAGKSFYFTPQFARELKTIRVGYSPADLEDPLEPDIRPVFRAAQEAVRSLGVQMVEFTLPDFPYGAVAETVISSEGSSVFQELIESGKVNQLADKRQIAGLKAGLEIPACDYLRSMQVRRLIQEGLRKATTEVDILLAPSRYALAPKIGGPLDRSRDLAPTAKRPMGLRSLLAAGNLAGMPALSLPCGFAGGLPVGMQLVGRPFTENLLLSVGMHYQKLTDWHRQRPKI
jgi:aspartyl-tRNA(Asn)/glutamyl-tRNA(Gln) amidotransferase subunit A